jgi:hypothetical protein
MRPFRRSNGSGQQISHVESVAQSSYLLHIHHNKTINLRILFLIETAISQGHICGCCAAGHGLILILFLGFVASCCEIVVGNFSMISVFLSEVVQGASRVLSLSCEDCWLAES